MSNLLFICSRNQWRSPTAEAIWRKRPGYQARSAGTASSAKRKVNESDIAWADLIFVMEHKHKRQLQAKFPKILSATPVFVLDIPDEYHYMDVELVDLIETSVAAILESTP